MKEGATQLIYTVTFNPAIDYVVRMDSLSAGQINRADTEEIQFGGKGINVSTVLKTLGVDNVALGFLAGFTGRAIEDGLAEAGIRTDFIHLKQGLTRINVKVKAAEETEINGVGPHIDAQALEALFVQLDALKQGDILVLAGSIPASLPSDIYQTILSRLEGRGILTTVDATRDLLVKVLPYRPFLIKPNDLELGEIFGRALSTDEEIRECASQLQVQGARNVLVSMAAKGAMLLDESGGYHRIAAPSGTVKNSVGAGDSMVAGFLAGFLEQRDYAHALRLGAAAGSATAFSTGLATREDILRLLASL